MCVCFVLCCYGVCKSFDWQSWWISRACRGACVIFHYEIWQLCKEKYGMLHGHLYTDMVYRHGSALYLKYSGWGNIKSLVRRSISRHCTAQPCQRYGDTFFAIVLMLTVIVSLFPLTVIKAGKYMHGMCWEIRFLDDNTHTA